MAYSPQGRKESDTTERLHDTSIPTQKEARDQTLGLCTVGSSVETLCREGCPSEEALLTGRQEAELFPSQLWVEESVSCTVGSWSETNSARIYRARGNLKKSSGPK